MDATRLQPAASSDAAHPHAIAMWDFSWLERRWPGAGYEDWDQALGELTDRGYDAVRIDAYPHLIAADPDQPWDLLPCWDQQTWGAPAPVSVRPLESLIDFLRAARRAGVRVALSTWFRDDTAHTRMRIRTPANLAHVWATTLGHLDDAGLLADLLYVDLCNEFPLGGWAPFLYGERWWNAPASERSGIADALWAVADSRADARIARWMREPIELLRTRYPQLRYMFSFSTEFDTWEAQDISYFDDLDIHIWMANSPFGDYYETVGYYFERFSPVGYDNVVRRGKALYESRRDTYDAALFDTIDFGASWSRRTGKPLYTTEGWSLVDYKDWPGLEWGWILDLNALAIERAAATGRWAGLCTSNFCGPQFVGMWREVGWHRDMTSIITGAQIDNDLR